MRHSDAPIRATLSGCSGPDRGPRPIDARKSLFLLSFAAVYIGRDVRFPLAEHGAIDGHAMVPSSTFRRIPSQPQLPVDV